jgi:hypothetical protein
LVVGVAGSGKTRAAYEAIRRVFSGDWRIIVPLNADSTWFEQLAQLNSSSALGPAVLWLDDLQRFIDNGALTPYWVRTITAWKPPVIIVATIRTSEYTQLTDQNVGNTSADKGPAEVFRFATVIHLPSQLTASELAKVAHPFLAGSSEHENEDSISNASALTQKYLDGKNTDPVGWAIIRAAIDWRRTGVTYQIRESQLRELFRNYLPTRSSSPIDLTTFKHGLDWALGTADNSPALLDATVVDIEPGYAANDYLVAFVEKDRTTTDEIIAPDTWALAIRTADPSQALSIGRAAYLQGQFDFARDAFRKAATSSLPIVAASGYSSLASIVQRS